MIRARYLLIILLLGISIVPVTAQREVPMPEVSIEPIWEGLLRTPGWSELQVTLNNEGSDWEGELVLLDTRNETTYRLALELPAHSNKQYRIPIFMDSQQQLKASLQSKNGYGETYPVKFSQGTSAQRICAIADSWGTINFDDVASCRQKLPLDTLTQLPESPMAWDTIDVLIINGMPSADLTPAQQESLLAWVAIGGHLVVGGGPSLAQSLAGLPEELQVATVANTKVVPNLTFSTETRAEVATEVATEVAVTTLAPQTDVTALLQNQSDLLAIRASIGEGYVDVLGWDLNLEESNLWLRNLWITDATPATRIWGDDDTLSASHAPRTSTLLKVPLSKVPALWQWMLLFPFYLLIIGPGTLIIVRRLKRPILAWVLIPAWIIMALLILAFNLSGTFSRRFPLVNEIATIYAPGSTYPARVVQGSAIYAPRARQLSWTHLGNPRNLAGQFLFDSWYESGDPFEIESRYLEQGSTMRLRNPLGVITWGTEGLYQAPQINSDLIVAAETTIHPKLSGSIDSEVELHNVMLVQGNGRYKITLIDTILSGEKTYITKTITETATTSHLCDSSDYPTLYAPPGRIEDTINIPNSSCHIIAEIDQVPFPIQDIGGTHLAKSCLIYTIPCPQQVTGMVDFSLIPNMASTENGWIDEDNYVSISKPGTTVDFMQPALLRIQEIEQISIDLSSYYKTNEDYPFGLGELLLWDWEDEKWLPIPLPATLSSIVITGEEAKRTFDSDQGVRLQLIPESNDGANFVIKIKVSGIW